ncbi:MAG TPA: rRNA maturation RNase YbeY [Bacteroidia bacterium]|nr:rRNA maturation RNase YbeY [Bacteroidia bacterium]
MPTSGITFRVEEGFKFALEKENKVKNWINQILKQENKSSGNISYLFCSDDYLLNINKQFLKHDFYTDIITFDYSSTEKIEGEIFISIDRVKENATTFKQPFQMELMRTIIHGVLHLCGYKDKKPADKKKMRLKENEALRLLD